MLPGKQSLGWRLLGRTLTKERPWGHVEGGGRTGQREGVSCSAVCVGSSDSTGSSEVGVAL